jgi:hypothetical protein
MKVAIVTAVWKRPEVFAMFAKGVKHLQENCPEIEFVVIVAGSEGWKTNKMVTDCGFLYIEIPNEPLALKVNAPVRLAGRLNVDYVLCVGSDDIITPELMELYIKHMRAGIDYIAVSDFYFYDTVTGKSLYWGGYTEPYRKGHACGAGRLISKRLLTIWGWKPWDIQHNKILDTSIQEKLKRTPHTNVVLSLKENNVYALDIKSETNMTPFNLWDNTVYINTDIIKKQFHYLFK